MSLGEAYCPETVLMGQQVVGVEVVMWYSCKLLWLDDGDYGGDRPVGRRGRDVLGAGEKQWPRVVRVILVVGIALAAPSPDISMNLWASSLTHSLTQLAPLAMFASVAKVPRRWRRRRRRLSGAKIAQASGTTARTSHRVR